MYCGFCICPGRQKPKTQSCLQGSMKLLPAEITFGELCIFLWVCMREKRGNITTQVFGGRQAIGLLDSQGSPRVRTHLSGPLTSEASNFLLWIPDPLTAPRVPRSVLSCPQKPTVTSVLKSQPSSTFNHMCTLSKDLAVCTSVPSYVSWANQSNCCVWLLQD